MFPHKLARCTRNFHFSRSTVDHPIRSKSEYSPTGAADRLTSRPVIGSNEREARRWKKFSRSIQEWRTTRVDRDSSVRYSNINNNDNTRERKILEPHFGAHLFASLKNYEWVVEFQRVSQWDALYNPKGQVCTRGFKAAIPIQWGCFPGA